MTIIYNVSSPADSSAILVTGGTTRYGIELNGPTGALVGQQILRFTVSLKKVTTPSGNITAVIRRASDDAVVATFQESILATSLTTSFLPYTFTLDTPYTLQNLDKILVEYSGAANVTIEVYSLDQFDGALTRRVRYQSPSYATGNTNDIVATIDDGIYPYSFDGTSFDQTSFEVYPVPIRIPASFTPISFTSTSFTGGGELTPLPVLGGGGSTSKKRNKFRTWVQSMARDLKDLFKIKPAPPPPEDVEIPEPQPPTTVTILSSPPTMETAAKLETINDKWSVVASILPPPPEARTEIIYPVPVILNPPTIPITQTKVTMPPSAIKQPYIGAVRKAEGSHIHSQGMGMRKPKNRSKTAATLNTLMILLELERQV